MKKFLSLLCVLVLSLSFVACGTTKAKGDLVTNYDYVVSYFTTLDVRNVSYEFTIKYDTTAKEMEAKSQYNYTVKGGFNYNYSVDLGPTLDSFTYTLKSKSVATYATIDGKEKATASSKVSAVYDRMMVYSDSKYTYKSPYESESYTEKEYFNGELLTTYGELQPEGWSDANDAALDNIISLISQYVTTDSYFFLEDRNMTIINSTMDEHMVIVIKCEGISVDSIEISYKDAYTTKTISIKVCDRVEIERPDNMSGYILTNPENYPYY